MNSYKEAELFQILYELQAEVRALRRLVTDLHELRFPTQPMQIR
jgi:hypothetical protein